jgi:eukaryotic-like serine/threonine-protein kinase
MSSPLPVAKRSGGPADESDGPEVDLDVTHEEGPEDHDAEAPAGPHHYTAGETIAGKYRLTRLVGEGGMGAVWLARNNALEVDVAVKLIRREMATPRAHRRLLREARAAARLDHPSLVRVFDFGRTQFGDPFIAMEHVRGEALSDVLARKERLAPPKAVRLLLPVAAGLHQAHERGIVHRDLKPENVLLVSQGTRVVPKVVDFGIAKFYDERTSTKLTDAGVILGSPAYMSPEQARGDGDVDRRADVWSFSVVLYETLTGKRPFRGKQYRDLLDGIATAVPTSITALGAGDEELEAIVRRGLAKDREDRWPTLRDMGAALVKWVSAKGVVTDAAGTALDAYWQEDELPDPGGDSAPVLPVDRGRSAVTMVVRDEEPVVDLVGSFTTGPRPTGVPRARIAMIAVALVILLAIAALIGRLTA